MLIWYLYNRDLFYAFDRLSERSGIIHDGFGNYTADVKCSWLIESNPNTKIRMHVEQFATECGWDHLYIYDGDSVEAPLLAVFSGLMHKDGYHIRRVPEVIARSGSVLLHFYSDVAYNMSGFNITYKINACPSRWVRASPIAVYLITIKSALPLLHLLDTAYFLSLTEIKYIYIFFYLSHWRYVKIKSDIFRKWFLLN